MDVSPLLQVRGLSLRIGGVRALQSVDLAVRRGTIHALIGPNGAGKSSLLNCVCGLYRPQHGQITLDGMVELATLRRRTAGYLSGGEQQILAIGRALMSEPRLLMLDEPSMGLAPRLVDEVFGVIRALNTELGLAVLLVEQNVTRALQIADRGYVMQHGRVALEGRAADLASNPALQEFYLGRDQSSWPPPPPGYHGGGATT
jgi:ABC-type branched-subunit amino acid transport system ATPase component